MQIAKRDKSYSPQTLLDFGSGLGTVEWYVHDNTCICNTNNVCSSRTLSRAAQQLWKDSLYEYQCVDLSNEMLDLAKRLRLGMVVLDSLVSPFKNWGIHCCLHDSLVQVEIPTHIQWKNRTP
jgi:hypothetical protein